MNQMSSRELIRLAEAAASHPASTSGWCRAAALLARQAIEASLAELWELRKVPLAGCSFKSQLLCLPEYMADKRTARKLNLCWWSLTLACHHQPYELAPSCEEVTSMIEQAKEVVAKMEAVGSATGRAERRAGLSQEADG